MSAASAPQAICIASRHFTTLANSLKTREKGSKSLSLSVLENRSHKHLCY